LPDPQHLSLTEANLVRIQHNKTKEDEERKQRHVAVTNASHDMGFDLPEGALDGHTGMKPMERWVLDNTPSGSALTDVKTGHVCPK
jgi:hypothetical protein